MGMKNQWVESLKIGDVVCDCRGRHLRIAEMRYQRFVRDWIRKALMLPDSALSAVAGDDAWNGFLRLALKLEGFLEKSKLFTKAYLTTLVLEDGAHCSPYACCCEPADDNSCHSYE